MTGHGSVSDLFVIIQTKATYKERLLLLWLCISYSITGVHFVGYPLWYQTPEFFCIDKNTTGPLKGVNTYETLMNITQYNEIHLDQYFKCTQVEACSHQYTYIIDQMGVWSLKSQFDLVCENHHIEQESLSLMLQGSLVGCIINLFYRVNPKHRKNVVAYYAILYGILSILSSMLANTNIHLVSWACFAYHVVYQLNFGNYFTLFSEKFDEEVAKVAPCFVFICLGTYGIIYPFLALITKSNWQILMSFHGACAIVCGCIIRKLEFEEQDQVALEQSLLEDNSKDDSRLSKEIEDVVQQDEYFLFNLDQFQELFRHTDLLLNFVLLVFGYAALMVTLLLLEIEMESLAGSIYVNLMIGSIALIGGALTSGIVLMRYSGFNALIIGCYISGFSLMFYIFAPLHLHELNVFLQIFWTAPGLINVLVVECFQDVLIAIIPAFFQIELIPIFLSLAQLVSSWIITYIPAINAYMLHMHLFPYVFYGTWLALSGFIFQYFVKVDKEKFNEVDHNIQELVHENSLLIATGTIQQTVRSSYVIKKDTSHNNDQSETNKSIRYSYINKNNQSRVSQRLNKSNEGKNLLDVPKIKVNKSNAQDIEMSSRH